MEICDRIFTEQPANKCDSDIVQKAIRESGRAYHEYSQLPQSSRQEIIAGIKKALAPLVSEIAVMELSETGMGQVQDKIVKLILALEKTPGLEDLEPQVLTGDDGITLYEYSAYGIVCAVQPGTNPCATIINNVIGMLAAGNSVIIVPHPRCVNVSGYTVKHISEAIYKSCGISNLVISMPHTTMQIADEIMGHPDVSMVVATGGGKMLGQALASKKRVIGAGAANPVAMVDETADLEQAARNIVDGASFDHNITCISEKSIVIVSSVADRFIEKLATLGVFFVNDPDEMISLARATINSSLIMKRSMEGKSANEILRAAGIACDKDIRLIVVETVKTHPFATIEMLMPLVPLIRAKDFDDMLEIALFIEQGYRHTATIHSQSVTRLNRAAQAMQTSIFVKNGSSLAALGLNGGSGAGFTIANITGEGVTTARNFARRRRCSLMTGLSIR